MQEEKIDYEPQIFLECREQENPQDALMNQKIILLEDENQDFIELQNLKMPLEETVPIELKLFQLPFSKAQGLILFSLQFLTEKLEQLHQSNEPLVLNSFEIQATDAQKWNVEITLETQNQNQLIFLIVFTPQNEFEESKGYKIVTILKTKGFTKKKDIKKTSDDKQKAGTLTLALPFSNFGAGPICIEIDITVETTTKYQSRDEVGFIGLINNSSLCYMNSVYQILFNLSEFRRLVFQIDDVTDQKEFPATLQSLFFNLMTSRTSVSTQEIIKSFKWELEQQTVQHDVQEFTMELLKGIQKRLENKKDIANQIMDLFTGKLEHHLEGIECPFEKVNIEEFTDLQLHIEGCKDLNESFQIFVEKELLADENAISTDDFGMQPVHKYHLFNKLPPVLFLNLKRYKYDPENGNFKKINDHFKYYDKLDIGQFVSGVEKNINYQYKLFSVLVHRGELINHGHYYCFIRPNDQWYKFDDRLVTKASEQQVYENNFGGTYEAGEFNTGSGQINVSQNTCPETAYLLVYVKEDQWNELLRPLTDQEIPMWIQENQVQIQNKVEQRNFIQIPLLTFSSLMNVQHNNKSLKNGLFYHKNAPNSQIDTNFINQHFNDTALQVNIPKTFTVQETIQYLGAIFSLTEDNFTLMLYRITQSKPDIEGLVNLSKYPKKPLSNLFIQKLLCRAFFIVTNDYKAQQQIEQIYLNVFNISKNLEYQQVNQNQIFIPDDDEKEKCFVLLKEFVKKQPPFIEFCQYLILPIDQTIQDTFEKCQALERFKETTHTNFNFYLQNNNFSIIKEPPPNLTLQDYIVKERCSYVTIIAEQQRKQMRKSSQILENVLDSVQQWCDQMNLLREVILRNQEKEKQGENCQIFHCFQATDDYNEIVRVINNKEGIPTNHMIIKYKDKKGLVQMKAPNSSMKNELEFELSPTISKAKQTQKPQNETIETFIQMDPIISYKYTPISVFDLKTQFAINYDIYLRDGTIKSFQNVICAKDTQIEQLILREIECNNLDPLLMESQMNPMLIIPLLIVKKNVMEVISGRPCALSLAKLKGKYNIAFTNKVILEQCLLQYQIQQEYQPDQEPQKKPQNLIIKMLSSENELLTTPIIMEVNIFNKIEEIHRCLLQVLTFRKIDYADEIFEIKEYEILITSKERKQRKVPSEFTLFYCYRAEEKVISKDQFGLELSTLTMPVQPQDQEKEKEKVKPKEIVEDMEFTYVFESIQDQRRQRLREQGVKLNL